MKIYVAVALALVSALVGFAAGHRSSSAQLSKEREDLALQGVMQNLAQIHFLERQDAATAVKLANINMDGHLRRLVENEGHISDPQWLRSKAKTLNAVALLWEGDEPFKDLNLKAEIAKDWAEGHARNLAMLGEAKEECRRHPEYNCKTSVESEQ